MSIPLRKGVAGELAVDARIVRDPYMEEASGTGDIRQDDGVARFDDRLRRSADVHRHRDRDHLRRE